MIERAVQKRVKGQVDAAVGQMRKEMDDAYARRLQALENEVIPPYRGRIEELEGQASGLQDKIQQLSKRPTQEELEELKREHDQKIKELRSNYLEIVQNSRNQLTEIKSLRHLTHLVVAPHGNPLYMAFYLMGTDRSSGYTCYFIHREDVTDYLVNFTRLKELTMLGFPLSPEDIIRLDIALRGSITLVGLNRYAIPQTRHTQIKSHTPVDYLRYVYKNNGNDMPSSLVRRIDSLSSLVKQVDSGSRDSHEARLLSDTLRFPVPLPQETALSLAYHLAEGAHLDNFEQLSVLQERASYFT